MAYFTMITRHGTSRDMINSYTLISDSYQTITVPTAKLAEMAAAGQVTNIKVGDKKGIESTNGALEKYTFVNSASNEVEGTPRAVILDRVEQNGKLLGYTVFMQNGQIRELNTIEAAGLASKGLISNGKIRHTAEGDIVSAIGGTYPLRTIAVEKAPTGDITVEILFFASSVKTGKAIKYAGAMVHCTSAVTMSKIIDKLTDSNAKVKASVANLTGNKDTSSLAIKRMGANSLYGVFDLESIKTLIGKAKTSRTKATSVLVSVIDYNSDAESVATIENKKVAITKKGSDAGAKAAVAFGETLVKEFSTIL